MVNMLIILIGHDVTPIDPSFERQKVWGERNNKPVVADDD